MRVVTSWGDFWWTWNNSSCIKSRTKDIFLLRNACCLTPMFYMKWIFNQYKKQFSSFQAKNVKTTYLYFIFLLLVLNSSIFEILNYLFKLRLLCFVKKLLNFSIWDSKALILIETRNLFIFDYVIIL